MVTTMRLPEWREVHCEECGDVFLVLHDDLSPYFNAEEPWTCYECEDKKNDKAWNEATKMGDTE
jgi:hypothetical protein